MRPLPTLLGLLLPSILAAPAAAQFTGHHVYEPIGPSNPFLGDSSFPNAGIGRELRNIRHDIHAARESGEISGREARQLKREARAIEQLAANYADGGLSRSERDELETRTRILSDAVTRQR
jgi:hypothetical protein